MTNVQGRFWIGLKRIPSILPACPKPFAESRALVRNGNERLELFPRNGGNQDSI